MKWFKSIAISYFLFLFMLNCTAQEQTATFDSLLKKAFLTDELLPMLIDSAIKYSPQASIARSNEDIAIANYEINKKDLFNALSIRTSYGYGTAFSAVNNQSAAISENFTTGQTAFYNVGVGLQLPLTQLINRKNIKKGERSVVAVATADKQKTVLFIRQDVIKLYQDLKLVQRLMTISSKNKQSSQVNFTLGEKNFLNGQITVDQVSLVTEAYNKAIIDFETNLIKFQTSFMLLETYVGINISKLITKIR